MNTKTEFLEYLHKLKVRIEDNYAVYIEEQIGKEAKIELLEEIIEKLKIEGK